MFAVLERLAVRSGDHHSTVFISLIFSEINELM